MQIFNEQNLSYADELSVTKFIEILSFDQQFADC